MQNSLGRMVMQQLIIRDFLCIAESIFIPAKSGFPCSPEFVLNKIQYFCRYNVSSLDESTIVITGFRERECDAFSHKEMGQQRIYSHSVVDNGSGTS